MTAADNHELVEVMAGAAYTAWRHEAADWQRAHPRVKQAFRNEQIAAIEAAEAAGAVIHVRNKEIVNGSA